MKDKNVLGNTMKPFMEPSFEETCEIVLSRRRFYNSIPDYTEDTKPTKEEIEIVEKVLKYASKCKYISFTEDDFHTVLESSTHILKWNFGYNGLPK